ncbi:MAG: phospho-N-acetylmuramoyl-pentapeptide-transferase [Clostridia bacterium]|nr:phospho-N-acetylmuramoyl-pentapeptide-transferase [Clostridia bacterium]
MNVYLLISLSAVAAFGITALLGFKVIPWLHKLKFGQTILEEGPKWHKKKQGTPTMGGLMFIIGITLSAAVVLILNYIFDNNLGLSGDVSTKLWAGLIMALLFGLVGFADDYIKVVKKRNLGLSIMQKTAAQLVICAGYLASLYLAMGKDPYMFIPFVGNVRMGFWFWILGVCVLYGAINAVNFTDGIDGLCSSVTATAAVSFITIAIIHKCFGVGVLAAAMLGGCIGFVVWNKFPAKVFMGDTGSMFLGGLVVAIAYALDCPLILLLVGIIYVIEALSDVIQIGYFKLTHGKRIFKMAPIHHHFELCGWSEKKIDLVFSIVNLIGGAAAVLIMYYGGFRMML